MKSTAQLSDNWPVDITLNSTLNVEPLKGEKVKLKVGGALREQLEIGVNLYGPVDMDLRAQTRLAEAGLPLNVEVNSKQIYWPFTGEKQYQADDLKLKLTGKMTDYTLSMRTAVKGPLNVEVNSKQIYWPFTGEKQYQADDLKLKLTGKMTDYTLSMRTAVKGLEIPPATNTLDAKGNEQQVNLDKLTVAALEGKTELKALLDWQQAISWRGELTLNGINTAKEIPEWPSKLNGLIKTRGSLYGGTCQMEVPELKLTGNVKQNKVNVDGTLKGLLIALPKVAEVAQEEVVEPKIENPQPEEKPLGETLKGNSYMQWMIPGLHLELGPNSAEVKGELGVKDLNLDATINAPGLDNAQPGLGGTEKGLVKVRGTVEAPQLLADRGLAVQRKGW